jgi:hypothetical protein
MTDVLKYYIQLWNLSIDGEPFSSYPRLLQPVTFNDKQFILKIARRGKGKPGNELMA